MNHFSYRGGTLYCEDVSVEDLAERFGTPLYVYSKRTLTDHYTGFMAAFSGLSPEVRFSVKSCWNVHLLRILGELGCGMDVVSGGELYRALAAGIDPKKIVAAGVGKTNEELRYILESGVGWLNVESEQEFCVAAALAGELGLQRRAALRVNPDVADPLTHEKTTTGNRGAKFGVDLERAEDFFRKYSGHPALSLEGLHVHLGSPIYDAEPYCTAIDKLLGLVSRLGESGIQIESLDLGGGFAADYDSTCPPWTAYAEPILAKLSSFIDSGGKVIFEPGRTISANTAVLLSTVQYTKVAGDRNVAIVDAGMSDFIRPAFYDAYHFTWPTVTEPSLSPKSFEDTPVEAGLDPWNVVGPLCETSDYFVLDRRLPALQPGQRMALFGVGAYGIVQSNNYNSRPRPAEVLVDGSEVRLIRRRETYEDLLALEV